MSEPRRTSHFSMLALVAWLCLGGFAAPVMAEDQAGDFDYYVLSLSWQPAWCAQERETTGPCRTGAAIGFTLHGLWPQYERGYPSDCRTQARDPSRNQTQAMTDIMGSAGLAWHEWKKHGRCSGLSATEYFAKSREALGKIVLPPAFGKVTRARRVNPRTIEAAFLAANRDLRPDSVTVKCRNGRITEVRICMNRDLEFRICSPDMRRECETSSRLDPLR